MNRNFWKELPKPFFALAPMADVTDPAFRRIVAKYGKPDVMWTEFVSADGLNSPGREVLRRDLEYTEVERPIVAQLFSSNVENMKKSAELCRELGFDGIDINMGCPDRSIEKQGCGAAMIKTPEHAVEIIKAAKEGAGSLPVSVKTRIGYNTPEIETWIRLLLEQDLAALTVHCRTRKELSNVPAHWEYIKTIVDMRDQMGKTTRIIGNGDVRDLDDARQKARVSGCDGIMIGRAIFGNPWMFATEAQDDGNRHGVNINRVRAKIADLMYRIIQPFGFKNRYWLRTQTTIPLKQKLGVLIEHAQLFEQLLGDVKNFAVMKKHFKAYINGFDGAKELRIKMMEEGNSAPEVKQILTDYIDKNK